MDKTFEQLLPVLRITRGPLVSGYLWLLNVWAIVDWSTTDDRHLSEEAFAGKILEATSLLGSVGQAIALSVGAFLVGSFISFLLEQSLLRGPTHLRRTSATHERRLAEGRFRIELAIPLFLLLVLSAIRFSPAWSFVLIAPMALLFQGNELYKVGRDAPAFEEGPQSSEFSTRYAAATKQIVSEHLVERLAGVHELGKLAQHSEDYRESIFNVLASFLRVRGSEPGDSAQQEMQAGVAALGGAAKEERAGGQRIDLSGVDLQGLTFDHGDFRWVIFHATQLENTSFLAAKLEGAVLTEAHFRGADLTDVDLSKIADLSGADFTEGGLIESNLSGLQLSGVILKGADLRGATLSNADLRRVKDLSGAMFSAATTLVSANLSGLNVAHLELAGADLSLVKMRRSCLPSSMQGAALVGADLVEASLDGVDFSRADLTDADLSGATTAAAIFVDAKTEGVSWPDATHNPAHQS